MLHGWVPPHPYSAKSRTVTLRQIRATDLAEITIWKAKYVISQIYSGEAKSDHLSIAGRSSAASDGKVPHFLCVSLDAGLGGASVGLALPGLLAVGAEAAAGSDPNDQTSVP
jgi:hypothetical protein